MYKILPSKLVPSNKKAITMGLPISNHLVPDITFVSENNSTYIDFNSAILVDALLNSKDILRLLGLEIKQISNDNKESNVVETKSEKKVESNIKETKSKIKHAAIPDDSCRKEEDDATW